MEQTVGSIMCLIGVYACFSFLTEAYKEIPDSFSKGELIKAVVVFTPILAFVACWVYFAALRVITLIILLNT